MHDGHWPGATGGNYDGAFGARPGGLARLSGCFAPVGRLNVATKRVLLGNKTRARGCHGTTSPNTTARCAVTARLNRPQALAGRRNVGVRPAPFACGGFGHASSETAGGRCTFSFTQWTVTTSRPHSPPSSRPCAALHVWTQSTDSLFSTDCRGDTVPTSPNQDSAH